MENPKQIADILNSENIQTPSVYKMKNRNKSKMYNKDNSIWFSGTVNNILRNEQHKGTLIGGKTEIIELGIGKQIRNHKDKWVRIPNAHPAIITQEIWELSVAQKAKFSGNKKKQDTRRMLYKRVHCGYCGHVFRYRTSSSRNYYICRTVNYTDKYGCASTQYSEDEIINVVKTVVKSHLDVMLDLERLSTALKQAQNTSSVQKIIARLTGEIEQLQSSKRLLYERYKKGSLDKATYFKDRESIEGNVSNKILERETLTAHSIEQDEALNIAFPLFIDTCPAMSKPTL